MLGVRPEAVRVSLAPSPGAIPMVAHIIEPLGAYDIVDLSRALYGARLKALKARACSISALSVGSRSMLEAP
jgi:hypothetical protein